MEAPYGWRRFAAETGINEQDWLRFWPRWGDAVHEAGLAPNTMQNRYPDEGLTFMLASEARRLGRFPPSRELRLRHSEDASFPDAKVFQNRWRRQEQLKRVAAYCREHPEYQDVLAIAESQLASLAEPTAERTTRQAPVVLGEVYLLRVGRHYKLGRTNAFGRRERELAIQLPERAQIRPRDQDGRPCRYRGVLARPFRRPSRQR